MTFEDLERVEAGGEIACTYCRAILTGLPAGTVVVNEDNDWRVYCDRYCARHSNPPGRIN